MPFAWKSQNAQGEHAGLLLHHLNLAAVYGQPGEHEAAGWVARSRRRAGSARPARFSKSCEPTCVLAHRGLEAWLLGALGENQRRLLLTPLGK
jgi:hypothetical protein